MNLPSLLAVLTLLSTGTAFSLPQIRSDESSHGQSRKVHNDACDVEPNCCLGEDVQIFLDGTDPENEVDGAKSVLVGYSCTHRVTLVYTPACPSHTYTVTYKFTYGSMILYDEKMMVRCEDIETPGTDLEGNPNLSKCPEYAYGAMHRANLAMTVPPDSTGGGFPFAGDLEVTCMDAAGKPVFHVTLKCTVSSQKCPSS